MGGEFGFVKMWNAARQWGMIRRVGKDDLFFDRRGIAGDYEPQPGDAIAFDFPTNGGRRPRAISVRLVPQCGG